MLITISLILLARACRADALDVAATQAEVNRILATNVQELPAVYIVDRLPRGDWGAYAENEIRLSREIWSGCEVRTLAHEVSHYIAFKAGLLAKIPSDINLLKAELEAIAERVEDAWPGFAPNCRRRTHW